MCLQETRERPPIFLGKEDCRGVSQLGRPQVLPDFARACGIKAASLDLLGQTLGPFQHVPQSRGTEYNPHLPDQARARRPLRLLQNDGWDHVGACDRPEG